MVQMLPASAPPQKKKRITHLDLERVTYSEVVTAAVCMFQKEAYEARYSDSKDSFLWRLYSAKMRKLRDELPKLAEETNNG